MIPPRNPADETQRLRTLQSMRILDTPAEEQFDQITRVARRLFNVPIALVSLVDENRQWFKSRQGLDAAETPRSISFCGHAILAEGILAVEDATQDERFHDNPLVCNAPDIRFYAGYPLRAPNGHKIGTLCIIDRVPRTFTDADRELLTDLGRLAEQQLRALALATMDELTRIPNRRGFYMLAEQMLASWTRARRPSALLVFDLDGFKLINDQAGHEAGDRALVEFARCLLLTCREADVIGRLGGDEFCVLLAETDAEGAARLIARLNRSVAESNARRNDGLQLAFSGGTAVCVGPSPQSIDFLLAEADKQMFASKALRKRSGKEPPATLQRQA
jgi:diguanylate cyclase (GGDEF)-like protein